MPAARQANARIRAPKPIAKQLIKRFDTFAGVVSAWHAQPLGIAIHDHIVVGRKGDVRFKGQRLI